MAKRRFPLLTVRANSLFKVLLNFHMSNFVDERQEEGVLVEVVVNSNSVPPSDKRTIVAKLRASFASDPNLDLVVSEIIGYQGNASLW